jgi:hypothetical protein
MVGSGTVFFFLDFYVFSNMLKLCLCMYACI